MSERTIPDGGVEHGTEDCVCRPDGGLREPALLKLHLPPLDVRRPELVERLSADLATADVLPRHRGVHRLCGRFAIRRRQR